MVMVDARRLDAIAEYPTDGVPISSSIELDASVPFELGRDIPLGELDHRGDSEFEPDQIHVSLWTTTSILFSWATGIGRVGSDESPPPAYDVDAVDSVVEYGLEGEVGFQGRVVGGLDPLLSTRIVYNYTYSAINGPVDGRGSVYQSPILHHVVVSGLKPGATYVYRVGSETFGFSDVMNVTVPALFHPYPFKIGVVADLGQTRNSSLTVERMLDWKPDIAVLAGDLSYADAYYANGTFFFWKPDGADYFKSYQPRWDSWARMMQPLASHIPFATIGGNHEIESIRSQNNLTHVAYNARFPNPQNPANLRIATSPNDPAQFWDQSLLPEEGRFLPSQVADAARTNNTYYSVNAGPVHFIFLNNYVPYGKGSVMYKWLLADLQSMDRRRTPWCIVSFHAPWYSTYMGSYKENAEMQHHIEPLLKEFGVDLVLSGHVHAYDRSTPVYKYKTDTCGPIHVTIGDGGNAEGLTAGYIDNTTVTYSGLLVDDLCRYPETFYVTPGYQPTYSGRGYVDTSVPFCYASQAPWSDVRDPSFGHGEVTVLNETALEWKWNRNVDGDTEFIDHIIVQKLPKGESCSDKVVMNAAPSANHGARPWSSRFGLEAFHDILDTTTRWISSQMHIFSF